MTEIIEAPKRVQTTDLEVAVHKSGLSVDSAGSLIEAFQPIFHSAATLVQEAEAIQVTDATQVSEIKKARAMRLKLKDVRVSAEHARKQLKEEALRKGKAIDGIANIIKFLVEPVEERLLEQEQFAERKEAERKAALRAGREELLRPFGIDTSFYQLGDMPDATFAQLLDSSRLAHEAKLEAARKAEADRLAAEAARIEEEKRVREENARLKREAEEKEKAAQAERDRVAAEAKAAADKARREREAIEAKARKEREAIQAKANAEAKAAAEKARKEREAAEAKARKEREAREALEAKVRAEKQAAERKAAAEAKAKKAAELAPDRDKLIALAATVRSIQLPSVASAEAKSTVAKIGEAIQSLARRIEASAEQIGADTVAA